MTMYDVQVQVLRNSLATTRRPKHLHTYRIRQTKTKIIKEHPIGASVARPRPLPQRPMASLSTDLERYLVYLPSHLAHYSSYFLFSDIVMLRWNSNNLRDFLFICLLYNICYCIQSMILYWTELLGHNDDVYFYFGWLYNSRNTWHDVLY